MAERQLFIRELGFLASLLLHTCLPATTKKAGECGKFENTRDGLRTLFVIELVLFQCLRNSM